MIHRTNGNIIPETPDECAQQQCYRCEFEDLKYTSHMSRPGLEISTCAYRKILVTLCLRESAIIDFETKTDAFSPYDKLDQIRSIIEDGTVGKVCSFSEKEEFIKIDKWDWVCFCDECGRPARHNPDDDEWFCAYSDCLNDTSVIDPDDSGFTAHELSKVEFERLREKYSYAEWI